MGLMTRRLWIGSAILLVVVIGTVGSTAQSGDDPRNSSEDYYDAIDGALCMAHHAAEGMYPIRLSLPQPYQQLPIGTPVDLEVKLRNPWLHQLHDMQVIVNTSRAPNVQVLTGEREAALENKNIVVEETPIGEANAYEQRFEATGNATEIFVWAAFDDRGQVSDSLGNTPEIHAQLISRTIETKTSQGADQARIRWDRDDIQTRGSAGSYTFRFWLSDGANQLPEDTYSLVYGYNVYYNTTDQFEFRFPVDEVFRAEGESTSIHIPLLMTDEEEGTLDISVFARAHFDHPAGTGAKNDGHFYRFTTMKVKGGDQLLLAQGGAGPVLLGPSVEVLNLMTRVVGFMTMLLVPVAMVTGGLFGKGSRRWMNRMTGGPKKRVLWHSAMSWIILGVATIHFLLALYEVRNTWNVGMFWGGLGWALLVSLGITGYYQVRMIKRWNYKTWRYTHLSTAVGVFVFGIMHTFIDGSDLSFVRDAMPWLGQLAWP